MSDITSFTGEYRFLSNFFPAVVTLDGETYPSVEHAYQAAKTTSPIAREAIRTCPKPGQAKRNGRMVQLRPDWEEIKLDVMRDLLWQKFQHYDLREQLLATGDRRLIEGNHWNDTFWGVCRGVGQNWLGVLLMEIREEMLC